ncbi:nucleotide sugar dehydrogenase [Actinomyces sp. B33]|uniref:nucleotide sugar dehydrogenase n=1 Tax=Actinomyces sp. B33 TaxID=2942131 RepID=UPI00234057E9|nr:nucleotide sugar dehydrogenase [Actinomyces sp. B33]MDC4232639.1 nucleotide sugar dehydrogenase [Actinomyces sp. B33]
MRIAVVALGKIGLPLAVQYARKGHEVVGVDVDEAVVDAVNAGREPFPGEARLGGYLAEEVASGRLRATSSYAEAIPGARAVVVVVPLVVDAESRPDFARMDAATAALAAHVERGTLISYETTLPVGTTRGRWRPMIERISGLVEGRDFHLVFSPERVLTGRVFADLRAYPKLIGGLDEAGARAGRTFYESVLDFDERPDLPRANGVWDMGCAEAAEMAKLAETTYRDVNIGLANQFARYADRIGIDVERVIEACNSQPYSHIHRPGIAVGGHCIPVYPRLYLSTDPQASIVRAARAANAAMPAYAVSRAEEVLGGLSGLRVAVLGAAYRGGVKETAFSGVFDVVAELRARGARVGVHDPLFSDEEIAALGWEPYRFGDEVDAVIVQADHDEYRRIGPLDLPGARLLVDGRRITDPGRWAGTARIVIGGGGEEDAPTPVFTNIDL